MNAQWKETPILEGFPSPEAIEAEQRGELIIMGCETWGRKSLIEFPNGSAMFRMNDGTFKRQGKRKRNAKK